MGSRLRLFCAVEQNMGHPLRKYDSSSYWFITSRCFQARKLMTPHSPMVREVCGGVLARAAELYGVKLYAYVFMSNHVHLVVGAQGTVLAEFMKYLLGNLSKKLAPQCTRRWFGKFWERRATVAPILDDAALEDRVKYVLAHGVKEGLVKHAREWEGLHCVEQFANGKDLQFTWFNWTKRWAAKHRVGFEQGAVAGRYEKEWASGVTLKLTPMPSHARLPPRARLAWLKSVVRAEEATRAGRAVLGMKAVKAERASIPAWRKRDTMPLCHTSSRELFKAWWRDYRAFVAHFRHAASAWLGGDVHANFPAGCFKPHVQNHVQNE